MAQINSNGMVWNDQTQTLVFTNGGSIDMSGSAGTLKGPTGGITNNGGSSTTVTALTPGATVSINPNLGSVFTLVPAQAETINAASVNAGQKLTLVITTSGTSAFVLTFGTNFKTTGTLSTGTVSGKVFTMDFVSDGVSYNEVARSVAM